MRGVLGCLMAVLVWCPVAAANPVEFAAGEQFVEPQAGDFAREPDAYYTDHRDLSAYTPATWRALRRSHAKLTIHLRYGRDFGPVPAGFARTRDVLPLLRGARKWHVPFSAWLVVPYADGYWAHENNVDLTRDAVAAYFAWAHRHKVKARAVLLDLEPSIQDSHTLAHLRDDPLPVIELFRRNAAPRRQCAAAREYAGVVDDIHAHGLLAAAALYPFVLDDVLNGDVALSDGLNLPLAFPGEFDEVGFMTMRAAYDGLTSSPADPSLQASYAATIDQYFPGGSLVLGVVGQGSYASLDAVVDDARMTATVSTRPIGMYSLETLHGAFGLRGVRAAVRAARSPYVGAEAAKASEISQGTRDGRSLIAALDQMVGAGTVLAGPTNGSGLAVPNPWPDACRA